MSILDVGEMSITQILLDDITMDGYLDILISTVNGNLYCYGTNILYHPLLVYNGVQNHNDMVGIIALPISRYKKNNRIETYIWNQWEVQCRLHFRL